MGGLCEGTGLPNSSDSRGVPSYAYLGTSCALRTTMVFPLMTNFFMFVLFFFEIIRIRSRIGTTLCCSSEVDTLTDDTGSSSIMSITATRMLFEDRVSSSGRVSACIDNKECKISLLNSDVNNSSISLGTECGIGLPIDFFAISKV